MKKITNHPSRFAYSIALLLLFLVLAGVSSCQKSHQANPSRGYVVLSPEIAEIIALLEGTDNVIGITEECTYPSEYTAKTVVGKFGALDKEKIISLKPAVVFASALEQQAIVAELAKLNIRVISVYPKTIEEMLQGIITVGDAIGKKERAVFVSDSLRNVLSELKEKGSAGKHPKLYLEIYREPLMSVSDKSFVGELIELSGADNIFAELERDYARVKAEDVIKAKPEIMICYSQDKQENISKRMGWQNIPAIKNHKIYFEADINPDWLLRAGPRCILGIKRLQEIINDQSK